MGRRYVKRFTYLATTEKLGATDFVGRRGATTLSVINLEIVSVGDCTLFAIVRIPLGPNAIGVLGRGRCIGADDDVDIRWHVN